jgi:hypothetical protein
VKKRLQDQNLVFLTTPFVAALLPSLLAYSVLSPSLFQTVEAIIVLFLLT